MHSDRLIIIDKVLIPKTVFPFKGPLYKSKEPIQATLILVFSEQASIHQHLLSTFTITCETTELHAVKRL